MEIVKIGTQQVIAASPVLGGEYGGGTVLAPEQQTPEFDGFNVFSVIEF